MTSDKKTAFIISPIGSPDSETRKLADDVKNMLIKPIVEDEFDFLCVRADESYENPKIDDEITSHLIQDDLVIADLTDHNANVFYELAVRHSVSKPVILLIKAGQKIPFDIATYKSIFYDFNDVKTFKEAEKELRRQVQAVVEGKFIPDSPIKGSLISLNRTRDSSDNWNEIYTILRNHTQILSDLRTKVESFVKPRISASDAMQIPQLAPQYPSMEQAIEFLKTEGFSFVPRSKEEVPDISNYTDSGQTQFPDFVRFARMNLKNNINWINHDLNNKILWFWIKEFERIFTWSDQYYLLRERSRI